MTTFRPVNTSLVPDPHGHSGEESNPLTPRPSTAPSAQLPSMNREDATTPTRANFGTLASQRPLPTGQTFPSPIMTSNEERTKQPLNRGNSQYSAKSRESEEMDMDSDGDNDDGSDDEASVNADGTRSSKKKGKSQRFWCTDYPPCNLSFTRSEHLARHIRKHTGERPFQCHCSRRFSRLDNLRQHAQTVHQNEDIPQDSLAATGTRFQRQVRTDRVRPPGRSRAGTASSQNGPIRGHQRNSLSLSSITSNSSAYSQREDIRRRPPPLVMAAGDPRPRYAQDMYRPESPNSQYPYRPSSPGFSTPTSATFSTGQNSPQRWSGIQSPPMGHSRTQSLYNGHRTPGRRLSVPSAGNPFQSPHGNTYGPPVLGQINTNPGSFSPAGSMLASPTTATSSTWSRRESISNAADEAWRRRTWHPDTYSQFSSSFTSRLQNVMTPNTYSAGPLPQPAPVPSNAPPLQQSMRLPGIESFDPLARSATPIRRQPSPMMIDTPSRPPVQQSPYYPERPTSQHWDQGINRNMNRLDITQLNPNDGASSWASEANRAVQAQAEQARAQPTIRFEESVYSARPHTSGGIYQQPSHSSAPPVTPTKAKRMGWYHGPMSIIRPVQQAPPPIQRTSPADSSGSEAGIPVTPNSSTARDFNPGIVHSNGWIENRNGNMPPQHDPRAAQNGYTYPPPHSDGAYTYAPTATQPAAQHQEQIPKSTDTSMLRLEALVAVAANEDKVATAY